MPSLVDSNGEVLSFIPVPFVDDTDGVILPILPLLLDPNVEDGTVSFPNEDDPNGEEDTNSSSTSLSSLSLAVSLFDFEDAFPEGDTNEEEEDKVTSLLVSILDVPNVDGVLFPIDEDPNGDEVLVDDPNGDELLEMVALEEVVGNDELPNGNGFLSSVLPFDVSIDALLSRGDPNGDDLLMGTSFGCSSTSSLS